MMVKIHASIPTEIMCMEKYPASAPDSNNRQNMRDSKVKSDQEDDTSVSKHGELPRIFYSPPPFFFRPILSSINDRTIFPAAHCISSEYRTRSRTNRFAQFPISGFRK